MGTIVEGNTLQPTLAHFMTRSMGALPLNAQQSTLKCLKPWSFEFKAVKLTEFTVRDVENHGALSLELQNSRHLSFEMSKIMEP